MRTTTVVWKFEEDTSHPPEFFEILNAKLETIKAKLIELCGSYDNNVVSEQIDATTNSKALVRSWPDLATATAWVEFMQGIEGVISAQVDPE